MTMDRPIFIGGNTKFGAYEISASNYSKAGKFCRGYAYHLMTYGIKCHDTANRRINYFCHLSRCRDLFI